MRGSHLSRMEEEGEKVRVSPAALFPSPSRFGASVWTGDKTRRGGGRGRSVTVKRT